MKDEDKTKQQLKAANQQLRANEQQLRAEITERKKSEEERRQLLHDLTERVKELNAFYNLSELVEKAGISLEEICQKTANLIPISWQYPDITCARLILDGKKYQTDNFKETRWKQSADIKMYGNKAGALEVFYLEERPKSDKGPFLKEEEKLINALAERLGRIVERKRAENQLRASEQQLKAANQQLRASEQQLRAANQQLRAHEQQLRAEITERKKAEEGIKHLNLVLQTIRNINQIITKEKDPAKLIEGICDTLVEKRGYYNSWIVLFDESGKFIEAAETGLGGDFMPLTEWLKNGKLTRCARKALSQQDIVITKNPFSECADCPLSGMYGGRGGVIIRLEYGEKVYGLLAASIPNEFIENKQEQSLFKEVAGDIAFALYNAEAEKERKQAEEKLRYFQKAVESSSDAIGMLTPQGRHYYQNEAFTKLFGLSVKEIDGTTGPVSTVYVDEKVGREVFGTIMKGEAWSGEVEMYNKDRHKLNISLRAYSIKDEKGKIIGLAGMHTDITEHKKAEGNLQKAYTKLKETQSQLIHAEKMEAVGRMASGVAHEVKNPLGIILQGINYFEDKLPSTQKDNQEMLQMMKNSIKRADSIVRALLDFSRMEELRIKPEDINSILESSMLLMQHKIMLENIEVIKDFGKDLPKVLADKGKIEQVFVNIFSNAIHAMPKGGKLFIRTYRKQLKEIRFRVGRRKTDGDYFVPKEFAVIAEIEDTGVGIPEDVSRKIFDPFFTTKKTNEGTGLGLSIVNKIMDVHRGFVDVKSKTGKGTIVIIALKISRRR